jgi:membrane protein YqaA with SNARE-associated domain
MQWLGGCASVFGLGFIYFILAIPTGAKLGLPLWLAATVAWLGYTAGGAVVVFAGAPLREWLMRRFKIQPNPEKPSLIHRAWNRFGLPAVGLLAPVTIGPQGSALLGLALGVSKWRLLLAISLGAIPWAIGFALAAAGVKLLW